MSSILIRGVDAITLEPGAPDVSAGVCIAIEGTRIRSVAAGPPEGFRADETIDGDGLIAMPGLVNAHCHAAMTLERGWAEDLPFDRWLNERIWVAESALTAEDVYWGAALAACEMIRSGTVAFADHYFWMDRVAAVVEQSGLKALLAWCQFGRGPDQEVGGTRFETAVAFARETDGAAGGRIRAAIGPHSPYMCSAAFLARAARAARDLDVPLHLHLSESEQQVRTSIQRHGRSPVAHVAALGVLDGPALLAHCICVDPHDVALLARPGLTVAHTPKTYLKLAMGLPPVRSLLDGGVSLALGSDGPASSSDLNLLEVLRLTALLQKHAQRDAEAMPVRQILELACAAKALGFADSGRIVDGAAADLVLIDTRAPHWAPGHDLAAGVVYTAHPADVRHVIVDGRLLLRGGELTTLDEERIVFEARSRARRMVSRPMDEMRRYEC